MCRLEDQLLAEFEAGEFDEREHRAQVWLFVVFMAALLLSGWLLSGCMSLTITDSVVINSGISQDKPIRAGVSTTGEAIGEALKAAGYGAPISIDDIKSILQEYRKIKSLKESRNRPPKRLLPTRDPNRKPSRLYG